MSRRVLILLVACLAPASALAHVETPEATAVFAVPDGYVVGLNVGYVRGGAPAELVCEDAYVGDTGWQLAPLSEDEVVVMANHAILRTEDGCDFDEILPLGRAAVEIDADPSTGQVAFATNEPGRHGIWSSDDGGRTFALLATDASLAGYTGLALADGVVYATATLVDRPGLGALVRVGVEGDVELTALPDSIRYPFLLDAGEGAVLWAALEDGVRTVFRGTEVVPMAGSVVVDTWPSEGLVRGGEVWIVGVDGAGTTLHGSGAVDAAVWTPVEGAGCVAEVAGEVVFCDGELAALERLEGVREDCPASSDVATVCVPLWAPVTADAGARDVSDEVGVTRMGGDSGCAVVGAAGSREWVWMMCVVGAVLGGRWAIGREKPWRNG